MTNNPINTLQRKVLHVQSVSTWAPLCIGPYSQAQTIYDSLIFVSGQIALNPGSMLLIDSPSFHLQVDQCLRNISRLLVPLYSNLLHMLNLVVYVDVNKVLLSEWSIIQITRRAFKLQIINHMHVMDLDAHDELYLPQYVFGKDSKKEEEEEEEEEEDEKQEREDLKLKHLARINKLVNNLPISVIKVNAIPKESLVELEAVCIKAKKGWSDDDDFLDDDVCSYGHMQFNTFTYSAKELKKIRLCVDPHEGNVSSDIYSWSIFLPMRSSHVPNTSCVATSSSSSSSSYTNISYVNDNDDNDNNDDDNNDNDNDDDDDDDNGIEVQSYLAFKPETYAAGYLSIPIEVNVMLALKTIGSDDDDDDDDNNKEAYGHDGSKVTSKEKAKGLLKVPIRLLLHSLLACLQESDLHIRFLLSVRMYFPCCMFDLSPSSSHYYADRLTQPQLECIQNSVHEVSLELGWKRPLHVVVVPVSSSSSSIVSSCQKDQEEGQWALGNVYNVGASNLDFDNIYTKVGIGHGEEDKIAITQREESHEDEPRIKLNFLAVDLLHARSEAWIKGE